jgi:hypothetical protein
MASIRSRNFSFSFFCWRSFHHSIGLYEEDPPLSLLLDASVAKFLVAKAVDAWLLSAVRATGWLDGAGSICVREINVALGIVVAIVRHSADWRAVLERMLFMVKRNLESEKWEKIQTQVHPKYGRGADDNTGYGKQAGGRRDSKQTKIRKNGEGKESRQTRERQRREPYDEQIPNHKLELGRQPEKVDSRQSTDDDLKQKNNRER